MISLAIGSRAWRRAKRGRHLDWLREAAFELGNALGRLAAAGLVLAVFLAVPAHADDSTIPCSLPPSKGANVAVHPGTAVSTTQDHQDEICTFAINGAVATSPPPNEVLSALNEFRNHSLRFLQEPPRGVFSVAALIAASAPVDEVPSDLIGALKSSSKQLDACLAVFFAKQDLPDERLPGGAFSCRGFRPYTDHKSKLEALREHGFAPGVPTLVISIKWRDDRYTSTLYLPRDLQELPAIPLQ